MRLIVQIQASVWAGLVSAGEGNQEDFAALYRFYNLHLYQVTTDALLPIGSAAALWQAVGGVNSGCPRVFIPDFLSFFHSDFMVKVVEVSDSSQQKTLRGHEAPVLSVTVDPKDDFLVSESFL